MFDFEKLMRFDGDGGAGGGGGGDPTHGDPQKTGSPAQDDKATGAQTQSWETFLAAQPKEIQGMYEEHVTGLKNTVSATRKERDDAIKELKKVAKTAEEGSEARKQLEAITAQLETSNRRAEFAEEAVKPEIGCTNPRLAWLAATESGLFKSNGSPDWEAIKAAAPELFGGRQKAPPGNAGSGTNNPAPGKPSMDDWIRNSIKP